MPTMRRPLLPQRAREGSNHEEKAGRARSRQSAAKSRGGSAPARRRRAAAELGGMRLGTAAKKVRDGIEETLTRTDLPP